MDENELFSRLEVLIQEGNETGARDFVAEHIAEFPEGAREKLMFAIFTEALGQEAAAVGLQRSSVEAMGDLLKAKGELNKAKESGTSN